MRMNRPTKLALQKATAGSDIFPDTAILLARGVGRGTLNAFMAAGWITPDMPDGLRQTYRITVTGRGALATAMEEARG
jgi:hypothetical protein